MEDFSKEFIKSLMEKSLSELIHEGAEKLLKMAVMAECESFLENYSPLKDEQGRQRVVRNGYQKGRSIWTAAGELKIRVPRVEDRGDSEGDKLQFHSSLVPPYLRRAKELDEFIPYLYLRGISSGDFSGVLSHLLGQEVSLSANTVVRLKETWEGEYKFWEDRDLSGKRYVYFWADGVYFNVRLEDDRSCILVIIGVTEDGKKELVAVRDGHRESEISWQDVLMDLKRRGLRDGPLLAVGDGAMGFWKALAKEYPKTRPQRCWVHKTANVLDKLPKSVQAEAKRNIQEIYLAPSKEKALGALDDFVKLYEAKYPKAVACLLKDKDETLAFYDFPAEHWRHIRSTNPIESTFATVQLRTHKTKGCGSRLATLTMVFKLIQAAEKNWQRIHGFNLIPLVLSGAKFEDGVWRAA